MNADLEKAKKYRTLAANARMTAKGDIPVEHRQCLLSFAASYEKLAEHAEADARKTTRSHRN
jgi:hypothetical protein